MKTAIKSIVNKILVKFKLIYEEHKLHVIFKNANVTAGEGISIDEYFSANLPADNFSIKIGPYVRFKKYCHILLIPKAELVIGRDVFFNNYCSINCLDKITIGDNTLFGEGVKLYDHNHSFGYTGHELVVSKDQFETAPITIGKNCWIGSNVTVLKGVTIGDNVIIGANCLIYKSVAANTVVKAKTEYITEGPS
ncbi:MAG: acyltransferase [Bacteroidota bacterium]|nr:acyltransferase [Bacteroidota bacterium]